MRWQELHEEFMALVREEDLLINGANRVAMRAMGAYDESSDYGTWHLREVISESIRARFELAATKAAIHAGPCPGVQPWQYWLHLLRQHLQQAKSRHVHAGSNAEIALIERAVEASALYCANLQRKDLEREQAERDADSSPPTAQSGDDEPKELVRMYFDAFPDVVKLDACWAARQRYREYIRWIGAKLKNESRPARSFRTFFKSGKRPSEYRSEVRPKGWK